MPSPRQFTPQKSTRSTNDLVFAFLPFFGSANFLCGRLYLCRRFSLFTHRKAQLHLDVALNLAQYLGIVFQCLLRVFPALSEALAFVRKPGATLFHRALDHREVQQIAFTRNALTVTYFKL